jgi:hypothetical protein
MRVRSSCSRTPSSLNRVRPAPKMTGRHPGAARRPGRQSRRPSASHLRTACCAEGLHRHKGFGTRGSYSRPRRRPRPHRRPPCQRSGYSQPRSSRVTRGITSQVIIGTVTARVIASLGTRASPSSSGSTTTTTSVVRGKMVIQVSSAIFYGAGGGVSGRPGSGNQVSSPVRNCVRIGPITCGSALEPGGALVRVEPRAQVLAGVKPVDDSVLAPGRGVGAEHLDAQVARKPARRRDDALQEPLVEGLVTGLHPANHRRRDRTVAAFGRRAEAPVRAPSRLNPAPCL